MKWLNVIWSSLLMFMRRLYFFGVDCIKRCLYPLPPFFLDIHLMHFLRSFSSPLFPSLSFWSFRFLPPLTFAHLSLSSSSLWSSVALSSLFHSYEFFCSLMDHRNEDRRRHPEMRWAQILMPSSQKSQRLLSADPSVHPSLLSFPLYPINLFLFCVSHHLISDDEDKDEDGDRPLCNIVFSPEEESEVFRDDDEMRIHPGKDWWLMRSLLSPIAFLLR